MPTINIPNIPSYIWKIIVSTGVVISLIGGVWAIDDRYIQKEVLEKAMSDVDLKFDLFRLENLRDQEIKYKMWMRESPNDQGLKDEYQTLIKREEQLKQKIDLRLELKK